MPELTHRKNAKNIQLYINIGKFLLKFLFYQNYMFDFSPFDTPQGSDESTPDGKDFFVYFSMIKVKLKTWMN